jgi:DNA-binding response OmpR family regulator
MLKGHPCPSHYIGVQSISMNREGETTGKILVVDDERSILELLAYNLRRNGYQVIEAQDGRQALELARAERPDLVILDLMLPRLDGLDVCRELRRESTVPIIMLTARDEEVDRIVGLELGADDYVTKPFSVRELIARVRAVLRRTTPATMEADSPATLRVGSLEIDTLSREARLSGLSLPLTRLEIDLLETLMRHPGQSLSREQLLDQVWGYDYYGDSRAVDSAVKRLRSKLRAAGGDPAIITAVRGIGYRLERPGPR